jgi:hypothetical protein|tara:strand:+ start:378 stop:482 length:105 start_codon:yes stop_codon:yes gene_type:complete
MEYSPPFVHYEINIFESAEKELSGKREAAMLTIK